MNESTDTQRIDALERYIAEHGGIVLHEGDISKARTGLGTTITGRSLRQAIDQSLLSMKSPTPARTRQEFQR